MKVLFDQGRPAPLRKALVGNEVATAYELGWSQRRIAIVVLLTTRWPRLQRTLPAVLEAVDAATPGSYREVSAERVA